MAVEIEDWSMMLLIPCDGQTLTAVLHSRGINIRYLGLLAQLSEHISVVKAVIVREMITRAAKHILRHILIETPEYLLSPAIAHFLNCFLGSGIGEINPAQWIHFPSISDHNGSYVYIDNNVKEPAISNGKRKKSSGSSHGSKEEGFSKSGSMNGVEEAPAVHEKPMAFRITSCDLWESICNEVKSRFHYELPKERKSLLTLICSIATLRSICQKIGIAVQATDYDFRCAQPFQPYNILDLFPIVKHLEPETGDGRNLFDAGKSFFSQGRLDIAYELLTEALAIFHQVYGPMHRDTANCYGNLAMVLFHAKDSSQALEHQIKSVIINERVLGLDHHDSAHSYGNLALFCHNVNKNALALGYIKRALYLSRVLFGNDHPDTVTTLCNIAGMLQDLQNHKQAIDYLMEALKCNEALLGASHLSVANLYHAIAIAYSQLGNYRAALSFEKKNYDILHVKVGDNDLRTIESNICLKQFTSKAVQLQIETRRAQMNITSQLSQVKLDEIKHFKQKEMRNEIGVTTSSKHNTTLTNVSMGTRPISEILSFINEKGTSLNSFADRNRAAFVSANSNSGNEIRKIRKKKKSSLKKTENNGNNVNDDD